MADYFEQFSMILQLGDISNVEPALAIYHALAEELEREEGVTIGFHAAAEPLSHPAAVWISSDDCGEPEHVITYVRRCAVAFGLKGRWGFCWSLSCSRMRLDGFGGGAHVLDLATGDTVDWLDCEHWLAAYLNPITDDCVVQQTDETSASSAAHETGLARETASYAAELEAVAEALTAQLEQHGDAASLEAKQEP